MYTCSEHAQPEAIGGIHEEVGPALWVCFTSLLQNLPVKASKNSSKSTSVDSLCSEEMVLGPLFKYTIHGKNVW